MFDTTDSEESIIDKILSGGSCKVVVDFPLSCLAQKFRCCFKETK